MIKFRALRSFHPAMLGCLPGFLSESDPRPAAEQLNENYGHGGGWHPLSGWRFDPVDLSIRYPGDPPYVPIAVANLRQEKILVYPGAWVLIVQPDGSFEVARMD